MAVYETNEIRHPWQVNDEFNGDDVASSMYSRIGSCRSLGIDLGLLIQYLVEPENDATHWIVRIIFRDSPCFDQCGE
jgi:hypothetical protein